MALIPSCLGKAEYPVDALTAIAIGWTAGICSFNVLMEEVFSNGITVRL